MIKKITNEVSMWEVWDNLRFFDKETLEAGPFPGYIVMFSDSSGFSDEQALIFAFREIRRLLELFNGDTAEARKSVTNYTVLDMLQGMIEKKQTYMFMQGQEYQFDIFLKMYQRRNMSRALVPLSHYDSATWVFTDNLQWVKLMNDLVAYKDDMVVIKEGEIPNTDGINFFFKPSDEKQKSIKNKRITIDELIVKVKADLVTKGIYDSEVDLPVRWVP